MTATSVMLWGRRIGAVEWDAARSIAVFQYTPAFARSRIELAPIIMSLREAPYSFPELSPGFKGLPGLLADSLPDKYGHRLIDAWLAASGREPGSMNPVERLCHIGRRGMGALEYEPAAGPLSGGDRAVDIASLTALANQVVADRAELAGLLGDGHGGGDRDGAALQDILRVGTSAGGARAKALLAWNPATGEFRSGQLDGLDGFEHWLLKFDGVTSNSDREINDPLGYGQVEYAYCLMARAAGIEMMPCRLHREGGRAHFMTRRFDRTPGGRKIHMQSLAALCHFDYNDPSSYSYEQAIQAIRRVCARPLQDAEQQFLRAAFNLIARNQDDHVKNIAFLMDPAGAWYLSPAFDVTYAWNPGGAYTGRQQMSVNGKRENFTLDDLMVLAEAAGIKPRKAKGLVAQVAESVRRWPEFAEEAGVEEERVNKVARAHRLDLAGVPPHPASER